MNLIRIAVLDDNSGYIQELQRLFHNRPPYAWSGAFTNSVRFLAELPKLKADVLLLDVNLPKISGLECIRQIREFLPNCRILMLTVHDEDDCVLKAFLDGASGYLLKESTPQQILDAINDAVQGGAPMTPRIARKVIELLGKLGETGRDPSVPPSQETNPARSNSSEIQSLLSSREFEILQLLASGKKYAEIAVQLFISLPTVKTHIHHIYEKLRIRNKAEAVSRLLKGPSPEA